MTCGIYMIQNKVNNKIYIGQAVDIADRWGKHKAGLRGNYHDNTHLQRSWNKYGEDNFEFTILLECEESDLNMYEEYYIFELMTYDDRVGYNKTYGGEGGRPTEKTRRKMSESHKGKTLSEETRKKLSTINTGKTMSEEARKKMSEAKKNISEETRKKLSESKKGENHPQYGKHLSEEHRRKMSEAKKIAIVQLTIEKELVKIYSSASEAERYGFDQGAISRCYRGKSKTHKGYKWMRLRDYASIKEEG